MVQLSQMPFFPMYDEHGESTRITFRTYDFVGDLIAAFEAIEAWCSDGAGEPAMLVRGAPGTGKSMLVAALVRQDPRVPLMLRPRLLHYHVSVG